MRPEGPRQSGAYGWLPSYRSGPRMTERAYPTSRHSELRCGDKCLRSLAKDIRERAHGWVAARAERQGTEDDVGLLRRLVPRCVRRPDVQLCDPVGLMIVTLLLLPETHGRSLATLETAAAGDRSLSHAYSRKLTISTTA